MAGNRYIAALNGYAIDMSVISDGFEKAIVVHEFPNQNGGVTEDMGLTARKISFVSFWIGDNYETHKSFLKSLLNSGLSEFTHPIYGIVQGRIRAANVRSDDGVDACEIEIEFIEDAESLSALVVETGINDAVESLWSEGVDQQTALAEKGLLGAVHGMLAAIENGVALMDALMANVTIPADTIIAATSFAASLPGRMVGGAVNCVARYAQAIKSVNESPVAFLHAMDTSFRKLMQSFASVPLIVGPRTIAAAANIILTQHIGLAAAQQLCLQAAMVFDADEQLRAALRQKERKGSFDANGNFIKNDFSVDILNVRDLERSLSIVRKFAQERVGIFGTADATTSREVPALKDMCAALLSHILKIKIEMEKVVDIDVDPPMSLHALCVRQGLPYSMADRVLAINNIENPNFVSGGISIYVR